jgi:glycosyltransferase involved in cell wall biosynthesis
MTILQLISSEGFYGAESLLVTLAEAVTRLGHLCLVGVFHDSRAAHLEVAQHAARKGLPVRVIPCESRWDRKAIARIRTVLEGDRVSVLHAHGYKADIYGLAAARGRRVALVASCHNWPSRHPLMRAYAALDRVTLRAFDGVVAVSEPVETALRRWRMPADRMRRLANGVEVERFRDARPGLRAELGCGSQRLVGFVGRPAPEKGGEVLLEAARRICRDRTDTTFVFVGDGPLRKEWKALAARLGLAQRAIFTGARSDMPEVYASFDLVVLPSFNEAVPMCLLEAMAARKPVVATRVGSVDQVVIPEHTGLMVEAGDADGLEQAIRRVLDDGELADRLSRDGHAHVVREFSSDALALRYTEVYKRALDRRMFRQRKVPAEYHA